MRAERTERAASRVVVMAVDGAVGLELAGACQVFGSAVDSETGVGLYDVRVCGSPSGVRITAAGLEILRATAPYDLSELATAGTVVVPASELAVDQPAEVLEALRTAHAGGARIASICTGACVLAAAGLLDGRRATTHWAHAAELARRHPSVEVTVDALYLDDGDIATSAGVTAGLDLCLHLVRRDHGSAVAAAAARRLVMAPHRDGGQAQYVERPAIAGDDRVVRLLDWMGERLDQTLTLGDLAAAAMVSERTLSREFRARTGQTPLRWLTRLRLHRAQELLETTDLGVERVAELSGFGGATMLRRHFATTLGTNPTAYRRTFRG